MKIAIDGPAAAGKTTLAKNLADALGFKYIDTGALFRTVALFFLKNEIKADDKPRITNLCTSPDIFKDKISIQFSWTGKMKIFICGEGVRDSELRTPEVSMMASDIGTIPEVRNMLLRKERKLADDGGIVMEGRDITTVVLPDADLKIYLTADIGTRTTRRLRQLEQQSKEDISYEDVRDQLMQRDHQDMNRDESPLKKAKDAVVIDSTRMSADYVLDHVLGLVHDMGKGK